ncbi:type IV toxin-antitoxin system AbiEi family antitoxin domain-containing protein [Enterococcus timonensis]|uniref:type IV toxin-antitoxin system AbiEi family antitoxin domain-containing protein n=1 Tax=Enterococcus timonensis TaxID=1852364 RepID=UPI0008DA1ECA|nr:type IV toxin-antitoxin system AbiEi family antitoxin domain-containing protein [Enterococcus timonensis]
MLDTETKNIFIKYNGTLSTKKAAEYNIDSSTLRKAFLRGDLERPFRGIYVLPNSIEDDFFAIQQIYSKGIFSHETAMFLHRLSTFAPFKYYMTFPAGYSSSTFKKNLIEYKNVKPEFLQIGQTEMTTPNGNIITVYDLERTIVDILSSNQVQNFSVEESIKEYLDRDDKDLAKLLKYATILNRKYILERIKKYD